MAASKKAPDLPAFRTAPALHEALAQFLEMHSPQALLVAWSGGMDSTVLLHALKQLQPQWGFRLRAVHVHHHLQPDADDWARHCATLARQWGIACDILHVSVPNGRKGLEAAARSARYAALVRAAAPEEWILTAHHRRDQAETVLINLARGSGVWGLQGIAPLREMAGCRLARPLLDVSRTVLRRYAEACGLVWIEDPHNRDPARLRTAVRHHWLPGMQAAVPAMEAKLAETARWHREAVHLLAQWARAQWAAIPHDRHWLSLAALTDHDRVARKWLLQDWFARYHDLHLDHRRLETLAQWPALREDARAEMRIGGQTARYFAGRLFYPVRIPEWHPVPWELRSRLADVFQIEGEVEGGAPTLRLVPFRNLARPLKPFRKAFHQADVPPWLRPVWPVLCAGETPLEILGVRRLEGGDPAPRFSVRFIAGHAPIR